MKTILLTLSCALAAIGAAGAQETPRFEFSAGAGSTMPLGNTGRNLNNGWNVGGGFGYNFNSYVGAMLDLNYNTLDLAGAQLFNFGVSTGGFHILSATVDPIVHLTPKSRVDIYVTGGGGLYHRIEDYSVPTLTAAPTYNPFLGFVPSPLVEARYNRILGHYHTDYLPVTFGYRW